MSEISAMLAGLKALKAAGDGIAYIKNAEGAYEKAKLKMQLSEVAEQILSARARMLEVQEENLTLKSRISELERQARDQEELQYEANAYWETPAGGAKVGPYCAKCWDGQHTKSRMVDRGNGFIICPICSHWIESPNKPAPRDPLDGYDEVSY